MEKPWATYLAVSMEQEAEGLLVEAVEECLGVATVPEAASLLLEDSSAEALAKAL